MAPRDEVVLKLTFGPSTSKYVARAVAYAKAHASEVLESEPGVWQASFRLGENERDYGAALQLFMMVRGWRTTICEVDDSPEHAEVILTMLACSRHWLRTVGRCEAAFPIAAGYPKCRACPLYDPEWAAESGEGSSFVLPLLDPSDPGLLEIPDHLPDEWRDDQEEEGP